MNQIGIILLLNNLMSLFVLVKLIRIMGGALIVGRQEVGVVNAARSEDHWPQKKSKGVEKLKTKN